MQELLQRQQSQGWRLHSLSGQCVLVYQELQQFLALLASGALLQCLLVHWAVSPAAKTPARRLCGGTSPAGTSCMQALVCVCEQHQGV